MFGDIAEIGEKMDKTKQKNIIRIAILVILFALLLTADLVSKQLVCAITEDGQDIIVIENVLEFTYSENTGASFGMFGESTLFITIFTSIVCVGMIGFLFWKRKAHFVLQTGLVIMLAGAIGNLVDRIAFGYVRDFIVYTFIENWFKRPFAICNFADLVLIIGAIIMIVYVLFFYEKQFKKDTAKTSNEDIAEIVTNGGAETTENSENENNKNETNDVICESNQPTNVGDSDVSDEGKSESSDQNDTICGKNGGEI